MERFDFLILYLGMEIWAYNLTHKEIEAKYVNCSIIGSIRL